MQRKDRFPFPPQFLSLSLWEPQGLLGWKSQQKKALLYLFICPRQFAWLCMDNPTPPACLRPLGVLWAAHSDMPFTDTHHHVIKMPAGSVRSVFVLSVVEFQSSLSSHRTPETRRGSWRMTESNNSCEGPKNCQKERNY